jgi:asparagine synthase (glutamine-hydrolysing)
LGIQITLLTVGFANSPDITFSKVIAERMGIRHSIEEICENDFFAELTHITSLVSCKNTSHLENCLAFRYIAKVGKRSGIAKILSANGFDELFCGYDSYRSIYELGGEEAIVKEIGIKIARELELVKEIRAVTSELGVKIEQPFLSPEFVSFAQSIPIQEKITGSNDLVRKHILRKVAIDVGVPIEAALKRKKALQYGTYIHKHFQKKYRAAFSASNEQSHT